MATVKIDADKNANKALKILKKRKSPDYKKKEKELISKIKNGGPSEEWKDRYDRLSYQLK